MCSNSCARGVSTAHLHCTPPPRRPDDLSSGRITVPAAGRCVFHDSLRTEVVATSHFEPSARTRLGAEPGLTSSSINRTLAHKGPLFTVLISRRGYLFNVLPTLIAARGLVQPAHLRLTCCGPGDRFHRVRAVGYTRWRRRNRWIRRNTCEGLRARSGRHHSVCGTGDTPPPGFEACVPGNVETRQYDALVNGQPPTIPRPGHRLPTATMSPQRPAVPAASSRSTTGTWGLDLYTKGIVTSEPPVTELPETGVGQNAVNRDAMLPLGMLGASLVLGYISYRKGGVHQS